MKLQRVFQGFLLGLLLVCGVAQAITTPSVTVTLTSSSIPYPISQPITQGQTITLTFTLAPSPGALPTTYKYTSASWDDANAGFFSLSNESSCTTNPQLPCTLIYKFTAPTTSQTAQTLIPMLTADGTFQQGTGWVNWPKKASVSVSLPIAAPSISKINISCNDPTSPPCSGTLYVGKKATLSAMGAYTNPTMPPTAVDATWNSSKPGVVSVDENTGVITAVAAGTATITATCANQNLCGTLDGTMSVTPENAIIKWPSGSPTSKVIDSSDIEIHWGVGAATITPTDAQINYTCSLTQAAGVPCTLNTDDPANAYVSLSSQGFSTGSNTLVMTAEDNTNGATPVSQTAPFTWPPAITWSNPGLSATPTYLAGNNSVKIAWTNPATFAANSPTDNPITYTATLVVGDTDYTCSTSNSSNCVISSLPAMVTNTSYTVSVTPSSQILKIKGAAQTITFPWNPGISGITILPINPTPLIAGQPRAQSDTFSATVTYADGSTSTGAAVNWKSSNTAAVTVGPALGASTAATAVAVGSADITANAEGRTSNSVTMTVNARPVINWQFAQTPPRVIPVAVAGTQSTPDVTISWGSLPSLASAPDGDELAYVCTLGTTSITPCTIDTSGNTSVTIPVSEYSTTTTNVFKITVSDTGDFAQSVSGSTTFIWPPALTWTHANVTVVPQYSTTGSSIVVSWNPATFAANSPTDNPISYKATLVLGETNYTCTPSESTPNSCIIENIPSTISGDNVVSVTATSEIMKVTSTQLSPPFHWSPAIASIAISPTGPITLHAGQTPANNQLFSAKIVYADGSSSADAVVNWASDNTDAVTIDSIPGIVTVASPVAAGTANITASIGTGDSKITSTPAVMVKVTQPSITWSPSQTPAVVVTGIAPTATGVSIQWGGSLPTLANTPDDDALSYTCTLGETPVTNGCTINADGTTLVTIPAQGGFSDNNTFQIKVSDTQNLVQPVYGTATFGWPPKPSWYNPVLTVNPTYSSSEQGSSVQVSWTNPATFADNSPTDNPIKYTATLVGITGANCSTVAPSTTCTITGLKSMTVGQKYTVSVTAAGAITGVLSDPQTKEFQWAPDVSSIAISPANLITLTVGLASGNTATLSATVTYKDGSTSTDTSVNWVSDTPSKVTVTSSGVSTTATAIAVGSAHITASIDNVKSQPVEVTVTQAPAVSWNPAVSVGIGGLLYQFVGANVFLSNLPSGDNITYTCQLNSQPISSCTPVSGPSSGEHHFWLDHTKPGFNSNGNNIYTVTASEPGKMSTSVIANFNWPPIISWQSQPPAIKAIPDYPNKSVKVSWSPTATVTMTTGSGTTYNTENVPGVTYTAFTGGSLWHIRSCSISTTDGNCTINNITDLNSNSTVTITATTMGATYSPPAQQITNGTITWPNSVVTMSSSYTSNIVNIAWPTTAIDSSASPVTYSVSVVNASTSAAVPLPQQCSASQTLSTCVVEGALLTAGTIYNVTVSAGATDVPTSTTIINTFKWSPQQGSLTWPGNLSVQYQTNPPGGVFVQLPELARNTTQPETILYDVVLNGMRIEHLKSAPGCTGQSGMYCFAILASDPNLKNDQQNSVSIIAVGQITGNQATLSTKFYYPKPVPKSITLNPNGTPPIQVQPGTTKSVNATINMTGGTTDITDSVSWSSSNPDVVQVNPANGLNTTLTGGSRADTAKITAKINYPLDCTSNCITASADVVNIPSFTIQTLRSTTQNPLSLTGYPILTMHSYPRYNSTNKKTEQNLIGTFTITPNPAGSTISNFAATLVSTNPNQASENMKLAGDCITNNSLGNTCAITLTGIASSSSASTMLNFPMSLHITGASIVAGVSYPITATIDIAPIAITPLSKPMALNGDTSHSNDVVISAGCDQTLANQTAVITNISSDSLSQLLTNSVNGVSPGVITAAGSLPLPGINSQNLAAYDHCSSTTSGTGTYPFLPYTSCAVNFSAISTAQPIDVALGAWTQNPNNLNVATVPGFINLHLVPPVSINQLPTTSVDGNQVFLSAATANFPPSLNHCNVVYAIQNNIHLFDSIPWTQANQTDWTPWMNESIVPPQSGPVASMASDINYNVIMQNEHAGYDASTYAAGYCSGYLETANQVQSLWFLPTIDIAQYFPGTTTGFYVWFANERSASTAAQCYLTALCAPRLFNQKNNVYATVPICVRTFMYYNQ